MPADSFGNILRQAREAQHVDVLVASSRLHIRTDIINAIEQSDIKRMPPRSYSRNMITAYARYLGLDPNPLVDDYEQQAYASEISRERQGVVDTRRNSVALRNKGENFKTARALRDEHLAERPSNSSGRTTFSMYDDEEPVRQPSRSFDRNDTPQRRRNTQGFDRSDRANRADRADRAREPKKAEKQNFRKSTHSSVRSGKYNNAVVGESGRSKVVSIIAVLVILGLIVFAITRVVSCSSNEATKTTASGVTVSGLTDPEKEGISTTTETKTTPIIPTAAVFSYEIPRDSSAYIEVYIDGTMEKNGTFDGPDHDTFDVTGSLRFVTTNPDGVRCTVGGRIVELSEIPDNKGVYDYKVNFQDYLDAWKAENNIQ